VIIIVWKVLRAWS